MVRIPDSTIGALVSNATSQAYPIIGNVISFLEQDTLRLSSNTSAVRDSDPESLGEIKQEVKQWYDEFGWKKNKAGLYGDTAHFSQLGNTAHGYYEMSSHLSFLDRFVGGEFFLDAASGAISHPEYASYSWFYKYRVCVDLSLSALQEAASKLGNNGFCCMADICNLPFRDNVFDGIVSGYTIQHIPDGDQGLAVNELHRVLAPDKYCCIMTDHYSDRQSIIRRLLLKILKFIGNMSNAPALATQSCENLEKLNPPSNLYFCPRSLEWWRKVLNDIDCNYSLHVLRLLSKQEFEQRFANSLTMARRLRNLELFFRRILAKYSRFGLVEIKKKTNRFN